VGGWAPRAPEASVRPRRSLGASGRPLNFTVRQHVDAIPDRSQLLLSLQRALLGAVHSQLRTARWWGVQNFFGNLAGISAPVITRVMVDRTGSFASAFLIAAALALVGALAYGVIVRRIEPVAWHEMDAGGLAPVLTRQA
jgi:hypothetical protein